jgi:diaminopimelate decarboxylase
MGGGPSPFGMDEAGLAECLGVLGAAPRLRLRGVHAHVASGLAAGPMAEHAAGLLRWVSGWGARNRVRVEECNLGGGMGVDYRAPGEPFDWSAYGAALRPLTAARPGPVLRIEPGRAVAAYDGYYVTFVLDLKRSHGETFAVVAGGTHHLRTPAAKGHDQPFTILPVPGWRWSWARPAARDTRLTVAGQLCTPKDVLARNVPISQLRVGDVLIFAMAGAYGWNISHRDFLMHPPPAFHQVG